MGVLGKEWGGCREEPCTWWRSGYKAPGVAGVADVARLAEAVGAEAERGRAGGGAGHGRGGASRAVASGRGGCPSRGAPRGVRVFIRRGRRRRPALGPAMKPDLHSFSCCFPI